MSGLADEAQRLQDHMEQHYGVCLQASQWDAAIAALRQPATDAAAKRDWFISINKTLAAQREEDPDAGDMQGLVERVEKWLDGGCPSWGAPAQDIRKIVDTIQSLTARNATLLAKCLETEEWWENALLAPLGVSAQLAAERAKVADLVEGFGGFIGSPQSCKTWGLPDTEAVIIDTTLGKIKQARALIERMK